MDKRDDHIIINRRDFLKFAGSAGAGLFLGSIMTGTSTRPALAADGITTTGCFALKSDPAAPVLRAISLAPSFTLKLPAPGTAKITLTNVSPARLIAGNPAATITATGDTSVIIESPSLPDGTVAVTTSFAPLPGDRMDFIVISDTHLGDPLAEEHFGRVLRHINLRRPLFLANAGDNVDVDEPRQWAVFNERMSTLKVPLFTTIGNHDSYLATRLYKKNLGDLYYSVNAFDCQYLFLDNAQKHNNATLSMDGSSPGAQWDWLQGQLALPAKHRFVFFHFPVYGVRGMMDPIYLAGTPLENRSAEVERMIRLFRENGVEYICHGHEHQPAREVRDGIVHLQLGGGGGSKASVTEDCDVNFSHIFIDEKGIRDYTTFLYYDQSEIDRIEFCEPRSAVPASYSFPLIVHGIANNGRFLAVEPEIIITSGGGKIDGLTYTAGAPGRVALEARFGAHSAGCEFEVV